MTLADPPPPGYGIFHKYFFFFEPFPKAYASKFNTFLNWNLLNCLIIKIFELWIINIKNVHIIQPFYHNHMLVSFKKQHYPTLC